MSDSPIAFGNLGPSEIAITLGAVLLLFGARDLAAINSSDLRQRTVIRRGYVLASLGGLGLGGAVSALAIPVRLIALVIVAVAVAIAFGGVREVHMFGVQRMRWDLGMASASLLTCGITMDLIAWLGATP